MAISLTTEARIRGELSFSGEGGVATLPINEGVTRDVDNGNLIGEANAIYIDEFSIAASGTLNIDLSGALEDRLGNAVVFTAIKEILLIADAANTNNVVLGNGATPFVGPFNAGTATVAVTPGSHFGVSNYSAAGWAVGAGTSDILMLANSAGGTAVTGTIVIIGEA